MIGLDSNVVVRFLTQDDPHQGEAARKVFASLSSENPGYLPVMVLVEVWWVLRSTRRLGSAELRSIIATLVSSDEIKVEAPDRVHRALRAAETGADFADALIASACREAGCSEIVTFDKRAADALGMRLLDAHGNLSR